MGKHNSPLSRQGGSCARGDFFKEFAQASAEDRTTGGAVGTRVSCAREIAKSEFRRGVARTSAEVRTTGGAQESVMPTVALGYGHQNVTI